jgi:hypothetical protein
MSKVEYPVECCRTCGHRQYLARSCPFLPKGAEMSLLSEEEEAELDAEVQALVDGLAARLRDERTPARERAAIAGRISDIRDELERRRTAWRIHRCRHYEPARTEGIPGSLSREDWDLLVGTGGKFDRCPECGRIADGGRGGLCLSCFMRRLSRWS